jgi:hypothetical protein
MKKINKTYYWLGLLIFFTAILGLRYFEYFVEIRKEFFYSIFGLWICLILLPLFGEIEFFGIKLKKELDSLKSDVKKEIQSIKYEFANTNKQQVILGYGPPPTDNKILDLEAEIESLLTKNKQKPKIEKGPEYKHFSKLSGDFDVSNSTIQLFQIRLNLEKLLTKIWSKYRVPTTYPSGNNYNPNKILNDIRNMDLIDSNIVDLTRDILSICNAAVHGNTISEKQNEFVFKNGMLIYDSLKELVKDE